MKRHSLPFLKNPLPPAPALEYLEVGRKEVKDTKKDSYHFAFADHALAELGAEGGGERRLFGLDVKFKFSIKLI